MTSFDIIVAGNGALGLATARALAQDDPRLRVAVVGPAGRPAGASAAAGAMLGCYGEVTAPLLRTAPGRARLAKAIQASRLWPTWLEAMNADLPAADQVTLIPGTVILCNPKSGPIEDENYIAIQEALRHNQEPFEDLDPSRIAGLNPADDCRPARAMHLPREGSIDATRLLAALTALVERNPAQHLIDATVRTLSIRGDRITGVVLEDGRELSAATVVLAMGAATQTVLDELPDLARRIPRIFNGGGTSLLLEAPWSPLRQAVRTPNRAFACGLHALPRTGHQYYFGATNILSARPMRRTSPADMYFLLDCILEQIDQDLCAAQLITWQVGNRPVTIDTCPLIGSTSIEGLWLLTGTYRDGLFLSPLLARHISRRLRGEQGLFEDTFPPERKPINLYTLAEARAEALKHYMAMGWEHGIRLPKVGWHRAFPRFYQQMLDSLYDALGEEEFILPPELLAIVDSDRKTMVPFFRNYYSEVRRAWS